MGEERDPRHPDAMLGELVRPFVEDLPGRAVRHDPASRGQHDDPVYEMHERVYFVLDDDHRVAARTLEPLHRSEEPALPGGVEVRRRLVEDKYLRAHREDRGERHPLLLAAGERVHLPPTRPSYAHVGEGLVYAAVHLLRRYAQVLQAEGHLVFHLSGDELRLRVLEDQADVLCEPAEGVERVSSPPTRTLPPCTPEQRGGSGRSGTGRECSCRTPTGRAGAPSRPPHPQIHSGESPLPTPLVPEAQIVGFQVDRRVRSKHGRAPPARPHPRRRPRSPTVRPSSPGRRRGASRARRPARRRSGAARRRARPEPPTPGRRTL